MPSPKIDFPSTRDQKARNPANDEYRDSTKNDPVSIALPLPAAAVSPCAPLLTALLQLLRARECARACQRPIWDFAVEISELRAAGLTITDLRCLACQGYMQHAAERTRPGMDARVFGRPGTLTFSRKTCFVLTGEGAAVAAALLPRAAAEQSAGLDGTALLNLAGPGVQARPTWHNKLRELRVTGLLVKAFRRPASSQELILAAFEEERWPTRIDSPISPRGPDDDVRERLHQGVVRLNQNQVNELLRFRMDGGGKGVRWELRNANGTGSKPD